MLQLLLLMFERIAIIVMVAFMMTRVRYFRSVIEQRSVKNTHRFVVMVMFGVFGIIGTYTGLAINAETLQAYKWTYSLSEGEAIANSRVIGVVVGGLLGGWKVGLGAGLIAGIHRFTLGGFTAVACGTSTIIAGLIAGFVHHKFYKRDLLSAKVALVVGVLAETFQMLTIIILARPLDNAITLVQTIGAPMIIANGVGAALFILIIRNVFEGEEKIGAFQTQKSLLLAKLTTAHLREGLNAKSAQAACNVLLNEVHASAVAITDQNKILSHVGVARDHHHENEQIKTKATKQVLKSGKLALVTKDAIFCEKKGCPLQVAVISPLKIHNQTIGTLKVYFKSELEIKSVTVEYIKGLSALLSQQLEISNADKYLQLAKDAEVKALQAQVNPHFLFNTLNTIVSMIRTEPLQARRLLISLSRFFRHNLSGSTDKLTTLLNEIEHVKSYLEIEQARFKDKLEVDFDVDDSALSSKIPPMTLQPIIENSMKHGFKGFKEGCKVTIYIKKSRWNNVRVMITDNGIGIDKVRLSSLIHEPIISESGSGIGLYNVNRRLIMLFGEGSKLNMTSHESKGTSVSFYIPSEVKGEEVLYER